MKKKQFSLSTINHTKQLAEQLAKYLHKPQIITLTGDFGSGKTTFCQYFIRYLIGSHVNVSSPSFNILQVYHGEHNDIYHYDLYRLKNADEIYELAIDETWDSEICLIEWPQIIINLIPPAKHINIDFAIAEQARICTVTYQMNNNDWLDDFNIAML